MSEKAKKLIIVESPTKARTLGKFLGDAYVVTASNGHIRDLPKSKLGIGVDHDFVPDYTIPNDKKEVVLRLQKEAKSADEIYLATDPDREGEAIAWHIQFILGKNVPKRITFHEITADAVKDALSHPRAIDQHLVDAQQARRILDRLVGYKLSPLLWRKVRVGLSAGRVQSVALRLIVDREREALAFKPVEYWSLEAKVKDGGREFIVTLLKIAGKKVEIGTGLEADQVEQELRSARLTVADVKDSVTKRQPYPPFTTSSLQQAAANRLGFTSKKTMMIAQQLYEGVELGNEGHTGLITYMRTDSLNLSPSAVQSVRSFISDKFGQDFVPQKPRHFKTRSKGAQEAHEAVRPTLASRSPESVKDHLNRDQLRLYELIWQRFVACQMSEATYQKRSIDVTAGEYLLRASGSKTLFQGWLKVYAVASEDEKQDEESGHANEILPEVTIGETLTLLELAKSQHFTEPPPRYTEASLIKALEEYGIGRPSTYAPIISTIIERLYVERVEKKLVPSPLGIAVNDFLVANFPALLDLNFTAQMEGLLDEVAEGVKKWQPVIKEFYGPFAKHLAEVTETAERVKIAVQMSDKICPDCGKQLVIRIGRFGKFLACSGYPECKHTEKLVEKIEAKCPEDGGDVVLLRTKKGRPFYGCSNYPTCKYMSWHKPQGLQAEVNPMEDKPAGLQHESKENNDKRENASETPVSKLP